MTEDEAKAKIQQGLAEMLRILNEDVLPLAQEHSVEFEFLDMKYRLYPTSYGGEPDLTMEIYSLSQRRFRTIPRPPAKEGLLVTADEWHSSSFHCSSRYWDWHNSNWPELEEE